MPGRPAVEGPHRRRLGGRRVVPLAERGRGVSVVLEDFGDRRGVLADHAGVAVPVDGALGDRAGMHAVMVSTGEQRCTGRRADRSRMKGVVRQTVSRHTPEGRRINLPAHHIRQPEPDVVEQHDDDVRSIWGQPTDLFPTLVGRLGEREAGRACRRGRREGQHRSVSCRGVRHRVPLPLWRHRDAAIGSDASRHTEVPRRH